MLPYNLYCVGGDVKHYSIQSDGRTEIWDWLYYVAGESRHTNAQLLAVSGRRPLRSVVRRICHPCTTSEQHFRWPILRRRRPAHELPFSLRDTGLSPTTFNEHYGILILRRVL